MAITHHQLEQLALIIVKNIKEEFGIKFLYIDFRVGFWVGHEKAKEEGLYMQKYCGCIFSSNPLNATFSNVFSNPFSLSKGQFIGPGLEVFKLLCLKLL